MALPSSFKESIVIHQVLSVEQVTDTSCLSMFPEFDLELRTLCLKLLSSHVTVPGCGQCLDLDGAEITVDFSTICA